MKATVQIINIKQLRTEMPKIIRRIAEGERYLVLHRSSPAFELIPPQAEPARLTPLENDPAFQMGALGESSDGASSSDHDRFLYQT